MLRSQRYTPLSFAHSNAFWSRAVSDVGEREREREMISLTIPTYLQPRYIIHADRQWSADLTRSLGNIVGAVILELPRQRACSCEGHEELKNEGQEYSQHQDCRFCLEIHHEHLMRSCMRSRSTDCISALVGGNNIARAFTSDATVIPGGMRTMFRVQGSGARPGPGARASIKNEL